MTFPLPFICPRGAGTATGGSDVTSTSYAISGGDHGSFPKTQGFDGINSQYWGSSQAGAAANGTAWLGQQFPVDYIITTVRIVQSAFPNNACSSMKIEYSDNGSSWTTVTTVSIIGAAGYQTFNFASVGGHFYWRVLANSAVADPPSVWALDDVEMY